MHVPAFISRLAILFGVGAQAKQQGVADRILHDRPCGWDRPIHYVCAAYPWQARQYAAHNNLAPEQVRYVGSLHNVMGMPRDLTCVMLEGWQRLPESNALVQMMASRGWSFTFKSVPGEKQPGEVRGSEG